MKIFLIFLVFSFTTTQAFSKVCEFEYQSAGSELKWKAFKTPKKAGVGGKFSDFSILTTKAASLKDLLSQAVFSINTQSVETGDKGRDGKIMKFFFSTIAQGLRIKGLVNEVKASNETSGEAEVELSLNGETESVKMNYKLENEKLVLTGKIDVLEFEMEKQLQALNKACYALHEGKTWSDVELEMVATVKSRCK